MKTGYCKTLWSGGPKSWLIRMQMYMYFSAYNFGETKLHNSKTQVITSNQQHF